MRGHNTLARLGCAHFSSFMAILACLLLLSPGVAWSGDGGGRPSIVRVQPDRIRQGGVGFVEIESRGPVQVRLGSRELPLQRLEGGRRAVAWFGVDLETPPGALALRVEGQAGDGQPAVLTRTLTVLDGRFPVQRLTLPRTFVDLDPAAQERAAREKAILDRLWATVSPDRLWRGPFRPPLDSGAGPQGFGLRRIINGEPRAPHTGVDFSAAEGTAVFAAHGGVVALSEEHFFGGQSLVLDHGLGLYTMYFHLQERLVRVGAVVAQGERIGRVGRTGRATGPHLHWGARLLGARVDPAELLRLAPE